jgi:amino acid transporter
VNHPVRLTVAGEVPPSPSRFVPIRPVTTIFVAGAGQDHEIRGHRAFPSRSGRVTIARASTTGKGDHVSTDHAAMAATTVDADRARLHELGYAQELKRGMGWFSNFAVSFTIISILTGGITTFYLPLFAGGPKAVTFSWIIVGSFTLMVGLSMAEICSAYPTAGGLYYWSAKLANRNAPAWSWFTGWFNFVGQVAITASIDFGLATTINFLITSYISDNLLTAKWILFTYALVLALHGLINTFRVKLVAVFNDVSVWWHVIGVAVIVIALAVLPEHHQPADFIFSSKNGTGWNFPLVGLYVFMIGMLLAQYTITGFDASAHMTEETLEANVSGSKAIVRAIYVSAVAGLVLNLAMLYAIPKHGYDTIAGTVPALMAGFQLFISAIGPAGGKLLIIVSIVAQLFCGMASVTANSRMIYAFSRDGAVPGHRLWHRINPRTRTPTNSVWLAVVLAFLLGVPSLYQNAGYSVAFFAIVSIGTVGLYIAYIIPVFLRLRSREFHTGPWNLGRWSKPIGWVAVAWVVLVSIVFFLPAFYPWLPGQEVGGVNVGLNNFNWAGPLMLLIFAVVGIWWLVSAKGWFTGPQVQGTPAELLAIERELAAIEAGADPSTFVRLEEELEEELEERLHPDE